MPDASVWPGLAWPGLQAALQSKRLEVRGAVVDKLLGLVQQGQQQQQQQQEAEIWCHQGFLTAYNSVRGEVLRLLETALAEETGSGQGQQQQQQQPWTLYITGHSLGGALSTLCAFDCARRTWRGVARPEIVNYNYGSPRVGNSAFAEEVRCLLSCYQPTCRNAAAPAMLLPRGPARSLSPPRPCKPCSLTGWCPTRGAW